MFKRPAPELSASALLLLATPLVACSPPTEAQAPAPETAESPSPAEEPEAAPKRVVVDNSTAGVAQRHFVLFQEGKLDELLADYDDDAIVFGPGAAAKGTEELKSLFSGLLEEFEGHPLQLGDLRVRDDIAYITWKAETDKGSYQLGTDTFVIKHGRIMAHTFAAKFVPKDEGEPPTIEEPPSADGPTAEVLKHHLEALEKGDLEGIQADYTTDSLILTQKGKKSGKSGVKEVFEAVLAEFKNPKLTFELAEKRIEGETAYVLWSAKSKDDVHGIITETTVIRDGKIASQTVTLGL